MASFKKYLHKIIKPEKKSLKLKSMRAAFWSLLGRGGSRVLRMVSSLILTRILFPEAFGLMATANVILAMITLFSDTGVKTAIIQNPKGAEPSFLNTAWIIAILRGFVLCGVVLALAWPLSKLYEQSELIGILSVMAISPIINGFENPALALVIKKFRVEKQVVYELGTHLLNLFTTILFAWWLQSVYALAIGAVTLNLYRVVGSYIVERYHPKLTWDKQAAHELFHFGKYIFLNTMITWAAMNADMLLIGRLLDFDQLAFYSLGYNIGMMIPTFCMQIFNQAYMPAVSSVAKDVSRVQRIFRRTLAFILTLGVPAATILALFSADFIHVLYDPRYQLAAIPLFWIALRGVFRIIGLASSNTMISMGKPVYETISMGIGLLLMLGGIVLGSEYGGLTGASIGTAVGITLISGIESFYLVKGLGFSPMIAVRPWLQSTAVLALIFAFYYLLAPYFVAGTWLRWVFLILSSAFALGVSALLYRLMEGANPFRDQLGASKAQPAV